MIEVALSSTVKTVEVVEATLHWGEVPVAVAQMPFADGKGLVPAFLQSFRQERVAQRGPAQVGSFDLPDVHADFKRVPVRTQSFPMCMPILDGYQLGHRSSRLACRF